LPFVDGRMANIIAFGKSDPGLKRPNNEDAFLVRPELGLNVLADGMGGAAAGELASLIFVETARELFSAPSVPLDEALFQLLSNAFKLANERIIDHVRKQPAHLGMGCTAELLIMHHDKFTLGHVGDSRTYLYRKGELRQLTKDHSLVQEQLDQGLLTPHEARNHRLRHVILRAVGTSDNLPVDFLEGSILPGDLFLLSSDGLTDLVDDDAIQDILALPLALDKRVDRLVQAANDAGGNDNITVILSEVI
jgi:PPM family protein phosphatase